MKRRFCTALAGYFAGYLYISCMITGFSTVAPYQLRPWYVLLFAALFVLWGEAVGRDVRPKGKTHLLFLSAMLLIALAMALGRCRAAAGYSLLALHALAVLWALYRMGGNLGPDEPMLMLLDGARAFAVLPFLHFFLRVRTVAQGLVQWNRSAEGKSRLPAKELLIVIACLCLALPLLIWTASLLAQADANFGNLLENLGRFEIAPALQKHLLRLVLGLPIGAYLYGLLAGAAKQEAPDAATIAERMESMRRLPAAAANAVLAMFIALYLLFFGVQAGNLLAVFQGRVPGTLTAAEYARSGFFQLCEVMGVNFTLLALIRLLAKPHGRSLTAALMVQSLLLAATAGAKLALYISRFGFTPLRLLSAWGVLVLAAGCVFVLLGLAGRRNGFRNWLYWAVLSFVLLCFY